MTNPTPTTGIDLDGLESAARAAASLWRKFADEQPAAGTKIIALYNDGSGAALLFVHEGGVIDQDGDDYDKISISHDVWTYLPSGFEFYCESYPEDPVTLPDYVSPDDALISALRASEAESAAFGDLQNEHANITQAWREAEARATTAEAEVERLRADLTVIQKASQTSERIFGGSMSEVTRVFQNITRVAGMHLSRTRPSGGDAGGEQSQ